MGGAACVGFLVLRTQVRMLIVSEPPALHRFNSSLLESYVEVSQKNLPYTLGPTMFSASVYHINMAALPQAIH